MTNLLDRTAETAWIALIRGQQRALSSIEDELKAAGFPPLVWYDILLELDRSPEGALRNRDIEARMLLARYSVTRLLERMAADGLVNRRPCDDDARGVIARITPKGRRLRRSMWKTYERAIVRHFAAQYTKKEAKILGDLLARLSNGGAAPDRDWG